MAKNTYATKKLRWQRRLMQLVPELKICIALRNVDAASRLSARDQHILAEVIKQGYERRQPTAIRYLEAHPGATLEQVLAAAAEFQGPKLEVKSEDVSQTQEAPKSSGDDQPRNITPLVELLMEFGLQKNRVVAETVAASEYMSGVLDIVLALERARDPQGAQSETVTIVLCALAVRLVDQINALLEESYAHGMAVLQTDKLDWGRYAAVNSTAQHLPGGEDIEMLGLIINRVTGLGFVDSEIAAESPAMTGMLQLVSAYRRIGKNGEDEAALMIAARSGFAVRMVEDLFTFLGGRSEQILSLLMERCNWPEWFRGLLKRDYVDRDVQPIGFE